MAKEQSFDVVSTVDMQEVDNAFQQTKKELSNRYDLQLGAVTLPKSTNPAHILENASLDFVISEEDMALLKSV